MFSDEDDNESVFSDDEFPRDYDSPEAWDDDVEQEWPDSDELKDSSDSSDSDACLDDDDNSSGSTGGSFGKYDLSNSEKDELFECLHIADAAAEKEDRQVVQLEDGLWGSLPSELIDKIFQWLPAAAHCRFRCVCKRWRSLLSSPEWLSHYAEMPPRPSCSVMCYEESSSCWFFCHSEQKWFKLPLYPNTLDSMQLLEWELFDTDVGLVCYGCNWAGGSWYCVCNPLTKSFKVVPPNYPSNLGERDGVSNFVKLHVDRQTKSFKLVVLLSNSLPSTTLLYDSTTSCWNDCSNYLPHGLVGASFFVWKNVIYSQCCEYRTLVAFNMESRLWSGVKIELPRCRVSDWFIVSHNDSVLLVLVRISAKKCISVWKLRDEASNFSRSSLIEVPLDVSYALKPLLKDIDNCVSQGDWIFFNTFHYTNRWFTYTFATKSWRVMPCQPTEETKYERIYSWFNWEPRLDVNVESDTVHSSDQSIIESDLRWGNR